jgi:hypothetical protein
MVCLSNVFEDHTLEAVICMMRSSPMAPRATSIRASPALVQPIIPPQTQESHVVTC